MEFRVLVGLLGLVSTLAVCLPANASTSAGVAQSLQLSAVQVVETPAPRTNTRPPQRVPQRVPSRS